MPATYTSPVTKSPVIWTSRMNRLAGASCRSVQVVPLSVEKRTFRLPPTAKSFHETYIRPKNEEDVFLSAQPGSRSSEGGVGTQGPIVQLFGSGGLGDLSPPMP